MAHPVTLLAVLVVSFLAGVIPTAVYVGVFWWLDRYKKAPVWLLSIAFFWGAIPAIIISLIAELIFGLPFSALLDSFAAEVVGSGAIAPVVEESVKGTSLLFLLLVFGRYFDDVLDGIIFGAVAGLGFATTEDLLYFLGAFAQGGAVSLSVIVVLRKVIFGLNHAFFTSILGASLGQARLSPRWTMRLLFPLGGLALAIFFHAVHNLTASFASVFCWSLLVGITSDWIGIFSIGVMIFFVLRRQRRWIVEELDEEVGHGTLSPAEYYVVSSAWKRFKARWEGLTVQGWAAYSRLGKLYQWLTELAFKKHQLKILGEDQGTLLEISRLRARVIQLRSEMGLGARMDVLGVPAADTALRPPRAILLPAMAVPGREGIGIKVERFLVGRNQGDLQISNPEVSRRHAEIWQVGNRYRIVDLGSTNGTTVNGRVVNEGWLQDGDRVAFGPAEFTLQLEAAPAVEAVVPPSPRALSSLRAGVTVAQLTIATGSQKGHQFSLERETTVIGRQKGDLLIDDPFVSRQHAEVWRNGDAYYVADLKSRNGTFLNGELIDSPKLLHDGDNLGIGGTVLGFRFASS